MHMFRILDDLCKTSTAKFQIISDIIKIKRFLPNYIK